VNYVSCFFKVYCPAEATEVAFELDIDYPMCGTCNAPENIDENVYDFSDCEKFLGAGDTCEVKCADPNLEGNLFKSKYFFL
jgi:hypothetical protein